MAIPFSLGANLWAFTTLAPLRKLMKEDQRDKLILSSVIHFVFCSNIEIKST